MQAPRLKGRLMTRHMARRLAAVMALALALVGLTASAAQAAGLTNVVWSVSKPNPSSTSVRYSWVFTTATLGTIASIQFTVPAGTAGAALTPVDYYGIGVGTASLAGTTVTYTVTAPASVAAGVNVLISIDGFTNTATPGTYASTVTTRTNVPATIDTAGSGNVSINTNTTGVTVVVARSASFSNDTTSFTMLMDPSVASLSDQTHAVNLSVATNAANGYTLTTKVNQQLTGTANPGKTFAAVSTGIATGVASGSFPANQFGYTASGSGVGTVQGAGFGGGGYVGYTTGGEVPFSSTGPTLADTITLTNRAKVNALQSADTYTGTITYTVTPSY